MTALSLDRPLTSYVKVRRAIGALRRNRRSQAHTQLFADRPYLNIGCGHNIAAGFVNLDYEWQPGVDICWDLNNPLPIGDGALRGVFTEHCLEHLAPETAKATLREIRRVLAPGAVARIVLPDAGLFARLYAKAHAGEAVSFPLEKRFDGWTPMAELNRIMRDYGHLYGYDAETLVAWLKAAGFATAAPAAYRQGRDPRLLIDTPDRECESLYVEAVA